MKFYITTRDVDGNETKHVGLRVSYRPPVLLAYRPITRRHYSEIITQQTDKIVLNH